MMAAVERRRHRHASQSPAGFYRFGWRLLTSQVWVSRKKEHVKKVGAGWNGRGETADWEMGAGSDGQTAKSGGKKWKEQMCFTESPQGNAGRERKMESKGPRL